MYTLVVILADDCIRMQAVDVKCSVYINTFAKIDRKICMFSFLFLKYVAVIHVALPIYVQLKADIIVQ